MYTVRLIEIQSDDIDGAATGLAHKTRKQIIHVD